MTQEEEVREVRLAEIRRVLASMPEDLITLNEKFLLSEVDRLSQELKMTQQQRIEETADDLFQYHKVVQKLEQVMAERDEALAQVAQLRDALFRVVQEAGSPGVHIRDRHHVAMTALAETAPKR